MGAALAFKPDFEDAQRRWLAFWRQEIIDRPCCVMLAPLGERIAPGPGYMAGAREPFGPVIERILAHASSTWWGGDAMPCYTPSFGPDMMSAWLGAELRFDESGYGTSWAVPCVDDWDSSLPLDLETENVWWQRMLAFCRELAAAFEGKMLISHLDLHSNLDALAALRGPEPLCMDLMDCPETIDRAVRSVMSVYPRIYEGLYDAGQMARYGTTGWVPAYHPVRTNTIQCDFAALIGPDHFRRFVMPALEAEAAYLGHCVYHYDGPECLVHLDDICSIDGLDCIQWTTGARNKPFMEWLDLLREIQRKGKSLWVPCDVNSIKVYHRELDPTKLFYVCRAPSRDVGEATLKWLEHNT